MDNTISSWYYPVPSTRLIGLSDNIDIIRISSMVINRLQHTFIHPRLQKAIGVSWCMLLVCLIIYIPVTVWLICAYVGAYFIIVLDDQIYISRSSQLVIRS